MINGSAPYVAVDMAKKPADEIMMHLNRFNQAKDADWDNRRRGLRNMASYCNDIVPNHLKNALNRENRKEQNFNILTYLIRAHVGNVLMNWFDPKFNGRNEEPQDAVEALSKIYLANKEYYNYKASARSCFENGYIYRGIEYLTIDRPTSNPRTWGLKFVSLRPDLVILDPNVYTDNISRDSKEAWLIHYLNPTKIINIFGQPKRPIERDILLRLQKDSIEGPMFQAPTRDLFDNVDRHKFGSNYRVIEWMHIEYEKQTKQFLRNGIQLPQTDYEVGTIEDVALKKEWAISNGIELSDDMIITTENNYPCMYTTSFAPDLGILLDHRKDFRQLDGHLPIYVWSFLQKNGMSFGLVDYLWDIQQDFNKREMAKTKIITKTLVADKPWIRRDMFDSEDDFNAAVKNYTDPSIPLVIPENAPPVPEGFGSIRASQIPPSILQDETFKMQLAERVGMVPPALQGRSERQADSGVAIGRKVIEANVMMKQESESIIQHENDKHEDWTKLAIRLYGHPINMNRLFQSGDGKDRTVINELVGFDPVGNPVVRNNIGALKRVNVIISQTKENDYVSQARREMAVGALQSMQPNENNTLTRAAFEYTLATNMDTSTDEERERVKRLADKQLQIVEGNADIMLLGIQNQLNNPQGGGGMPVESQPSNGASPNGASPNGGAPALARRQRPTPPPFPPQMEKESA